MTRRILAGVACAATFLGTAVLAAAADWPRYLGPNGNNSAASFAEPLVEKFAGARLVWESDVPIPDGMSGDARQAINGRHGVSGGYASPVLADGRVYLQYYVPSGVAAEEPLQKFGEVFRAKFLVEADDVIHCFDAATGKTLWKAVFPRTAMNMQAFTKGGPSLTPCIADGKLYFHSNGGRIFCLDAATGTRIWEVTTDRYPFQEQMRQLARERRVMAVYNRDFKTSPAVIDGVVLFNDHRHHQTMPVKPGGTAGGGGWEYHYDKPSNLVALDAATGTERWRLPNGLSSSASPVCWTHGGTSYLIAAGGDNVVRCIEPKTGAIRWSLPVATTSHTPCVAGDYLVVAGAGREKPVTACYRMSATEAGKLWELPQEYGATVHAVPTVRDGFLYTETTPRGKLLCVELATGTVVATAQADKEEHFGYYPLVMGDRLICGGADTDQYHLYRADPRHFALLDDVILPSPNGYETPILPALGDGRMYLRTHDRLICLDLRQGATVGKRLGDTSLLGAVSRGRYLLTLTPEAGTPVTLWVTFTGNATRDGQTVAPAPVPAYGWGRLLRDGAKLAGSVGWGAAPNTQACQVDAVIAGNTVTGTLRGEWGGRTMNGTVTGQVVPEERYTEEEGWLRGWPMATGPNGNFVPWRYDVPLVDDVFQMRKVWESETTLLGNAKFAEGSFPSDMDTPYRPGGAATPIVAEGKVFCSSFRPSGEIWAEHEKGVQEYLAGRAPSQQFREHMLIGADDLLVAMDARTGKTLWTAVEAGQGVNRVQIKRHPHGVSPAYYRGTVFAMGTTGRLYAYDAATGQQHWETNIGPAFERMEQLRTECLAARTLATRIPWDSNLVVADGVLIVPMFDQIEPSLYGYAMSLRGVDVETGNTLWEAPRVISSFATPAISRQGGRAYLVCATIEGELRMLDPRTGKVLWTVTGLGMNHFTLSPSDEYVLVNVGSREMGGPSWMDRKVHYGLLGAYRITPQGAERVWTMPDEPRYRFETWMDSCAIRKYMVRDGLVYFACYGQDKADPGFLVLREATGEIVRETRAKRGAPGEGGTGPGWAAVLMEDRFFNLTDPNHNNRMQLELWRADAADPRRLSGPRQAPHDVANAYEVNMEIPYVAGHIFMRTAEGRIVCYDLTRPARTTTWTLEFDNGFIGLPQRPLPVQLWTGEAKGTVLGKVHPPTSADAGLAYTTAKQFDRWEDVVAGNVTTDGNRMRGTLLMGYGTCRWPVSVDLTRQGDRVQGTWQREIAGLAQPLTSAGRISGNGPMGERVSYSPRYPEQPPTVVGPSPAGVRSYVIRLEGGNPPLILYLDYDGTRITRSVASGGVQAWHEVDARGLRFTGDRLTGSVMVVYNADTWQCPNPATGTGIAGRITLDATVGAQGITGSYTAEFGIPWTATGSVQGVVTEMP